MTNLSSSWRSSASRGTNYYEKESLLHNYYISHYCNSHCYLQYILLLLSFPVLLHDVMALDHWSQHVLVLHLFHEDLSSAKF